MVAHEVIVAVKEGYVTDPFSLDDTKNRLHSCSADSLAFHQPSCDLAFLLDSCKILPCPESITPNSSLSVSLLSFVYKLWTYLLEEMLLCVVKKFLDLCFKFQAIYWIPSCYIPPKASRHWEPTSDEASLYRKFYLLRYLQNWLPSENAELQRRAVVLPKPEHFLVILGVSI